MPTNSKEIQIINPKKIQSSDPDIVSTKHRQTQYPGKIQAAVILQDKLHDNMTFLSEIQPSDVFTENHDFKWNLTIKWTVFEKLEQIKTTKEGKNWKLITISISGKYKKWEEMTWYWYILTEEWKIILARIEKWEIIYPCFIFTETEKEVGLPNIK